MVVGAVGQTLWSLAVAATTRSQPATGPSPQTMQVLRAHGIAWMLGRPYVMPEDCDVFLEDFWSRIWCSYRSAYQPIDGTYLTTDAGWGCMLRTAQMLLAEALLVRKLGKGWRLRTDMDPRAEALHRQIVQQFGDAPTHPFSIHRMAMWARELDIPVGSWVGPTMAAHVIRHVCEDVGPGRAVAVHVGMDGTVYTDRLRKLADTCGPVLVLVPLRLGANDTINPIYIPHIKTVLTLSLTVGIIGGRLGSAHYFVGWKDDHALFLDPHVTQKAQSCSSADETFTETYHSRSVHHVPLTDLAPSLCVAFYLADSRDVDNFVSVFTEWQEREHPLFTIAETEPQQLPDGELDF